MNAPLNFKPTQHRRRHTILQPLNNESQGFSESPILHLSTWASSEELFNLAEMRQYAALGMLNVVGASSVQATTGIDAANIAVPAAYLISDALSLYQAAANELMREMTYFGVLDVKGLVSEHKTPQEAAESIGVSIDRLEDWCAEGIREDNITQAEAIRLKAKMEEFSIPCSDIVYAVAEGKKGVKK